MNGTDRPLPRTSAADYELLQKAAADNFAGEVTHRLLTQLVRYALPTLCSLIDSGAIVGKYRRLARPGALPRLVHPLTPDQVNTLALDCVQDGVDRFLANERAGKGWTPGPASLTTWFVNACVLSIYGPWSQLAKEARAASNRLCEIDILEQPDIRPGPEQQAVTVNELERLLGRISDPLNRQIVAMATAGYTYAAIGEVLGMKEHTVGQRIRRLRVRLGGEQR